MQIVIDIPKEIYKASQIVDVKYEDTIQIPLEVILNGIPIPDNATNDDVLQIVFKERGYMAIHDRILQWLFAPYQKGGKE